MIVELSKLESVALTKADQAAQRRAGALALATQHRSIHRAAKAHPGRGQAQLTGVAPIKVAGTAGCHRAQRKLAGHAPARIVFNVKIGERPDSVGCGLADVNNPTAIKEPRGLQHAWGIVDRAAGNIDACARIDHRLAC